MNAGRWRIAGGIAVLAALALFGLLLIPSYYQNFQLQRFLEETVWQKENIQRPPDLLRATVINKASELGLPIRSSQVQVSQSPDRLRIAVRYAVRVDLPLYTVDLHFHPQAGRR